MTSVSGISGDTVVVRRMHVCINVYSLTTFNIDAKMETFATKCRMGVATSKMFPYILDHGEDSAHT